MVPAFSMLGGRTQQLKHLPVPVGPGPLVQLEGDDGEGGVPSEDDLFLGLEEDLRLVGADAWGVHEGYCAVLRE